MEPSSRLEEDIVTIKGAPQTIWKIPLKNYPDEGFYGAELHELIDRIIIGPTQFPFSVQEAFIALLEKEGVPDAAKKVHVSEIPLR